MTTRVVSMFDHLDTLTDARGLLEHADGTRPRLEHGYCTDDNARLLVVTARHHDHGAGGRLSRTALAFTLAALVRDGRARNRMDASGRWTDQPTTDDCWGRALWGLGVATRSHDDPAVNAAALAGFEVGARQRSPWPRAMAFAALGAAEVLAAHAGHHGALALLDHAVVAIGEPGREPWVWPEPRLRYANAALADAVIAAGAGLGDAPILDRGLRMLGWLLERETTGGHLSVAGVGGRGPADTGPQFDQQPIEIAAMADACSRAYTLTGHPRWIRGVLLAAAWFDGANDVGALMRDAATGGSYDGLRADGVNLNQGAESTLALISTMQRARDAATVS